MAAIEASEIFSVNASAKFIPATPEDQKTVRVMGGGTLYYKSDSGVSSSSNDGNVASGAVSSALTSGIWVAATNALPSTVLVQSSEGEVVTATVTGNETIAGTLNVTGVSTLTGGATVTGALAANGGITADSTAFTVANTSGDVATTGKVTVGGANPTTTADGIILGNGATPVQLYRSGADTLRTPDALTVDGALTAGSATVTGALAANGGITCDTSKFSVADGSGDTSIAGTLGVTGATSPSGGITVTSPNTRWFSEPRVLVNTQGTNSTPAIDEVYLTQIFIPVNCTLTGAALFNGTDVTDKVILALFNSAGVAQATTVLTGTAGNGTDAFQEVPFTATKAVTGPAMYWIGAYFNGTTTRYNAIPAGLVGITQSMLVGKVGSQTFGTVATIVPPSTQTADQGPYVYTY